MGLTFTQKVGGGKPLPTSNHGPIKSQGLEYRVRRCCNNGFGEITESSSNSNCCKNIFHLSFLIRPTLSVHDHMVHTHLEIMVIYVRGPPNHQLKERTLVGRKLRDCSTLRTFLKFYYVRCFSREVTITLL